MDYTIITETFKDSGQVELILACTSTEEALRIYEVATELGYDAFPAPKVMAIYGSKLVRIVINNEADRLILKLAL